MIRAIVTHALCKVVCIGPRSSCPMEFQRDGRLLQVQSTHTHGTAIARQGSARRSGGSISCQQCPFRASTCSRSVGSHSRYWKEQSVGAYRQCASYQIPVVTSYQLQHCCRVAAVADDALQPHRPRVKTKSGSTIPETCTAAQPDRTPSGSSASFTCDGALLVAALHPHTKMQKWQDPLSFEVSSLATRSVVILFATLNS